MAMRSSGTKRTIASRSFSGHEGQPETCRHHPLTCCRGSSGMVSLTLRASLTLVAHRDRVLSFLLAVLPSHPPSRLSQRPKPLYPSWHESCSGKCVQCARGAALLPGASSGHLLGKHTGSMLSPHQEKTGEGSQFSRKLYPCQLYRRLALNASKPIKNNPHVLTGTSAWNDIYAMYGATACCRARANGLSPSKLSTTARSGRSSSSSTSCIFPCC